MSQLIAASYGSEVAWMDGLSGPRLRVLEGRFSERRRRNAETTRLDLLMLEDRPRLVAKRPALWAALGFTSRGRFDAWSKVLQRTRDDLAHGHTVLDVEPDPVRALHVIHRVREFATVVWVAAREASPAS